MKPRPLTDPARYALQMLDLLESWGIAREAVLRRAGLAADALGGADGEARLTLPEADAIFTAARELAGRPDIGFEFGLRLKPTAHGLLGYGLIGCSDVDALWRLAARQQYHLTEALRLHYEPAGGGGARAVFTPIVTMQPERLAFNLEVCAVSTHVMLRLLLGERLPPFDIRMSMAPPPHAARYRSLQPTRFFFDPSSAPGLVVQMDRTLLAVPLPMAEPGVVLGVERQLSAIAPRDGGQPSWSELVAQILQQVQGAQVTLKGVAAQLGVSARTVDRRLAAEGVRFGDLYDRVRFERARELLGQSEIGVAQVARALGYRDAANFSRAFRRQAGVSPTQFREQRAAD